MGRSRSSISSRNRKKWRKISRCYTPLSSPPPDTRRVSVPQSIQRERQGERYSKHASKYPFLLEAADYACTRAASFDAWDIIGVGSTDFALVQVKTRDSPGSMEIESLR